jgi:hypothetical protein
MTPTLRLHLAINAIVPIVGVSVGDPNDKTTWTVSYVQEPTDDQKTQVQAAIDAFVWDAPTT